MMAMMSARIMQILDAITPIQGAGKHLFVCILSLLERTSANFRGHCHELDSYTGYKAYAI